MQDQAHFTGWEAQLLEDLDRGGYTQTRNSYPGQIQRPVMSQLGAKTDYWIKLDLYGVVHGYLNAAPTRPASLIIMEAKFIYRGPKTACRFRSARLSVSFTDRDSTPVAIPSSIGTGNRALHQRNQPCEPEATSWAPYRIQERSSGSTTAVEEDTRYNGELGFGGSGATSKLGAEKGKKQNYEVQYFSRGSSDSEYNEQTGRCDGVWWDLQENPDPNVKQRPGVESNVLFAVLVERKSDAPFLGHFVLKVTAQKWGLAKSSWSDITTGTAPTSDAINYDPAYPPQGKVEGIDATRLDRFQDFKYLAQLNETLRPLGAPATRLPPNPPSPSPEEIQ